jgi:hypothetical protein
MSSKFIEVNQVAVTVGSVSPGSKRLINRSHIVSVAPGGSETTLIYLEGGSKFNVSESYDDLKKMLGVE